MNIKEWNVSYKVSDKSSTTLASLARIGSKPFEKGVYLEVVPHAIEQQAQVRVNHKVFTILVGIIKIIRKKCTLLQR